MPTSSFFPSNKPGLSALAGTFALQERTRIQLRTLADWRKWESKRKELIWAHSFTRKRAFLSFIAKSPGLRPPGIILFSTQITHHYTSHLTATRVVCWMASGIDRNALLIFRSNCQYNPRNVWSSVDIQLLLGLVDWDREAIFYGFVWSISHELPSGNLT